MALVKSHMAAKYGADILALETQLTDGINQVKGVLSNLQTIHDYIAANPEMFSDGDQAEANNALMAAFTDLWKKMYDRIPAAIRNSYPA